MASPRSFSQKLYDYYEKSKVPVAYILFIYIACAGFIPDSVLPRDNRIDIDIAWLVLGLIILIIFFDIHKHINLPEKKLPFFSLWKDVTNSGEFEKAFKKRIEDDKEIFINTIGISSRFHWNYMKNNIEEYLSRDRNYKFNVNICILDPDAYDDLDFVDDNFKSKFYDNARGTISSINFFKKDIEKGKNKNNCIVNLYTYKFLPPFYGICLDNKFLFSGVAFWENGTYKSAGQAYNLYFEDDDFSGSEKIKIFNSWLDYIMSNSKEKTE